MDIKKEVVEAIVFDMDGTLLDTLQDLTNAVNVALSKYGLPEKTVAEVCKVVGNGARNLMKGVVPEGENHPDFEAILEDYKTYYASHCEEETKPYDGIWELLQELKKREYKMAVVSNKPDGAVKILAEKYFPGCFQVAIGDMEGYNRKPAPDLVYKALEELGACKEGAIYVGDSDVDLMTAMNAELPCVSVTWGFRDREFLMFHGASVFIDEPMELLEILQ
ncbi:MAG: HAD family hydrolase [Lachnospiraceae bacterium]|nr:HAD family hydrolase [Lachnospiraceae bacterium]